MIDSSNFTDKIQAADKQAGYDYQFYIFLLKCLELKNTEAIGYEEKDDVHIETNGKSTYIQVKHTVSLTSKGKRPNMTQKDTDLWKTLSNWTEIIKDENSGRKEEVNQLKYIESSEFIIISNKTFSDNNKFLELLSEFKDSRKDIAAIIKEIRDIVTENDSKKYSETDKQILEFCNQSIDWLSKFLHHLSFTLGVDNIIQLLVNKIKDRFLLPHETQAREVFNCMFANLKTVTYNHVSNGNRSIKFGYKEIASVLSSCLHPNNQLTIRRHLSISIPNNIETQPFIQELIEIGDLTCDDRDAMIEYTKFKVLMAENLKEWEQNHELLDTQKADFINDCITKWKNIHKQSHRRSSSPGISEDDLRNAGLTCIDEIRKIELKISDVQLDTPLSNGQFYFLSDQQHIGWSSLWRSKYQG